MAHRLQVIRRKVIINPEENFEQPFKVTLHKKNKKAGKSRLLDSVVVYLAGLRCCRCEHCIHYIKGRPR